MPLNEKLLWSKIHAAIDRAMFKNSVTWMMAGLSRRTTYWITLRNKIQWYCWLRYELVVPWPHGVIPVYSFTVAPVIYEESADPNDHYRSWLEHNVGKQGRAWNWRAMPATNELMIKFRHRKDAVFFALMHV